MESLLWALIIGAVAAFVWRQSRKANAVSQPAPAPPPSNDVYELAGPLREQYESTAHPKDVLKDPKFGAAADVLAKSTRTNEELLDYLVGDSTVLACLVVETLARRGGTEVRDRLFDFLSVTSSAYVRYFLLRAINTLTSSDERIIGRVLTKIDSSWLDDGYGEKLTEQTLKDFVRLRIRAGETPTVADHLQGLSVDQLSTLEDVIKILETPALLKEVEAWRSSHPDLKWLGTWGKAWSKENASAHDVIAIPGLVKAAEELEKMLSGERRRSVVIVGDSGVGKTALIRLLIDHLVARDWIVFEAGHNELVAGQMYIGQLEKRLQTLITQLKGNQKIIWYVPDLPPLVAAGRHSSNPTGALDTLLPLMEKGDVLIVSEAQPTAFENVVREKPRIATAASMVRLKPASEEVTLELAREWSRRHAPTGFDELVPHSVLIEAFALAEHYLGFVSSPGNLLELLNRTRRALSNESVPRQMTSDDVIAALSVMSGIPRAILDEREHLDLDALRTYFERRVMGQPEAVAVLVDRVALIKAGLTDPTRPLGVFLFAGPTGTGKTEIAKTLTEFLFGSANRMIRLDMSEFKSAETVSRLVGVEGGRGTSLVDQIRNQPFSIVLLDEFEKAHPNVWDYFLQLFDDGRLTDWQGRTADFRHCLIIMTSNVGASIQSFGKTGFGSAGAQFQSSTVFAALEREFRKEFLNRIDRVVVFRPLTRETMRGILRKELTDAYERRGLRTRPWAIEWDDSAIELLLEHGFTMDLGARPLKRAIERYVLAPIAKTIVNRVVPRGDQFLFVRAAGNEIAVDFVDPDAQAGAQTPPTAAPTDLSLEMLAMEPHGREDEVRCLEQEVEKLRRQVRGADWQKSKAVGMSMMALPEFWSSPERFSILSQVEYRDRAEAGFETAESLLGRLRSSERRNGSYPRDLIVRLAHQLFLLRAAVYSLDNNIPWEAYLAIESADEGSGAFARSLLEMYRNWSKERGMRLTELSDPSSPHRNLLALSGFSAFNLLAPEDGLHVLEIPRDSGSAFDRITVRVRVVPQPVEPIPPGETQRQVALRVLEKNPLTATVVRRYCEEPSPLVRDSIRNWRTGRLDLVLAGHFDLIV